MSRINVSKAEALVLLEVVDQARNDGEYVSRDGVLEGYVPIVIHENLRLIVDEFEKKLKAIVGRE